MRWVILITWTVFMLLAANSVLYTLAMGRPAEDSWSALLVLALIALFGGYGTFAGFRSARLTRQLEMLTAADRSFS